MANTFPSASTVIRRLKIDFGIDALPAHKFNGVGLWVANGLVHTFGPTVNVRAGSDWQDSATAAQELREKLSAAGWNVQEAEHAFDNIIRINSIGK